MKNRKLISVLLCVLLMFGICACGQGDAILSYDIKTLPLIGIEFKTEISELKSNTKGIALQEMYYSEEGVADYITMEGMLQDRDCGGSVYERYFFNNSKKLICMEAGINLMASSGYYRNAEKMDEFKSVAAENAKAVFEMIVSETGIAFDKTPEDIVYGDFLAKGNDGEREVYVKIHFGFPSLDKENFIAGENGSFTYCNIDMFVKPAGVTTGLEMAYEE